MCSILQTLKRELCMAQPSHIYDVVLKIFKMSIDLWVEEQGIIEVYNDFLEDSCFYCSRLLCRDKNVL